MKFMQHMMAENAPVEMATLSRRSFLKVTGGTAAGLVIGFSLPTVPSAEAANAAAQFNPFVRIAPDGVVTVIVKHLDMGQGTFSALATLVAEELDADWSQVQGDYAPADGKRYGNLFWGGTQGTGGSSGVANSFMQYRQAGAAAKAVLVAAAAKEWGVPASEITVRNGTLSHPSGKKSAFGPLAAAAAKMTPPEKPVLKSPDAFRLIGNPKHRRLDTGDKTNGKTTFTQDIQLPGMLVAVIARPPKFGATVAKLDSAQALKVKGVTDVVEVTAGVAVVAKDTWSALQGRNALNVTWDDSKAEQRSSSELLAEYRKLADQSGMLAAGTGDTDAALANASKIVEATFEFPYLAHAPMEPVNAVADLKPGKSLDIWAGSQIQSVDQAVAAKVAGLKPQQVNIHTLFAGGSFGRRATPDGDMVNQATQVAVAIKGRKPVKLIWSREDDIQGGYYRPMYVHKVRAGIDKTGNIVGWHHHIVGQSILKGTPFAAAMVKDGIDVTSIEGASELPYAVAAHKLELTTVDVGVPVLWWRSVGSTHTAYVVETMMDRLAKAAGQDPVAFRLAKMQNSPREAGALRLAVEKAGWGKSTPVKGVYRGVAVHKSFGSYVAQVADVRIKDDGTIKVEKVVCAIDCGIAVTPDLIAAQMEGGIGFGLGAILRNQITLDKGTVEQSQFFDYEPLRISDMPVVETHIVPSAEAPSGVGEPGTPLIGPAVANAIFWGTSKEVDTLPMKKNGLI